MVYNGIKEKTKFILIHGDLSKSNLIYNRGVVYPIDFSLSGYAHPEMDLADMVLNLRDDTLTPVLLNGYRAAHQYSINTFYIRVYSALSNILYIASHHEKVFKDEKFIKSLDRWCNTYINPVVSEYTE